MRDPMSRTNDPVVRYIDDDKRDRLMAGPLHLVIKRGEPMARGRVENLKKGLSPEEAREQGKKGGLASGEARRQNKTFREALEWALSLPAEDVIDGKIGKDLAARYPGISTRDAIAISAATASIKKQDVRAMVFARDTIGEAPALQVDVTQDKPFEISIKTID